jgi:hypothetical protein
MAGTNAVVLGPPVALVDTIACDDANALPGGVPALLRDRSTPLLVSGLAQQWPLYDRWSFHRLARQTRRVPWLGRAEGDTFCAFGFSHDTSLPTPEPMALR